MCGILSKYTTILVFGSCLTTFLGMIEAMGVCVCVCVCGGGELMMLAMRDGSFPTKTNWE